MTRTDRRLVRRAVRRWVRMKRAGRDSRIATRFVIANAILHAIAFGTADKDISVEYQTPAPALRRDVEGMRALARIVAGAKAEAVRKPPPHAPSPQAGSPDRLTQGARHDDP